MRITSKLTNANEGGSETADTIEVSKRFLQTEQLQQESDVINDLLSEAAVVLGEKLKKKVDANKIPEVTAAPDMVPFRIIVGMSDLNIPEIVKDEKGDYIVQANKYRIETMAVTVAVDGVVVGTTAGGDETPLYARPGLSKLRLTREGFKPITETINIRKNGVYSFAMQMDPAGYARWRENTRFLNDLKTGAKMSDAQIKAMEGLAKMLEQSGFRVDTRSDVKSDSKSDTKVNTTQPTQFQQMFLR
jgi:hypothetical protein